MAILEREADLIWTTALDSAQAFWSLLLPHGLEGGALSHIHSDDDDNDTGSGWKDEYTQWWFDFLNEKGGKGISKDTWVMVCFILLSLPIRIKFIVSFLTIHLTSFVMHSTDIVLFIISS